MLPDPAAGLFQRIGYQPAVMHAADLPSGDQPAAFENGQVVDEFVGAQPPAQVERFFDGLVPSEADALVESGDEASLRRALELEPRRADAAVPLARLLLGRGEADEALKLVEPIAGDFGAEGLAARIRLQQGEDPALQEAFAAIDAGAVESGLDKLLEALGASADGTREDLRRAIVGVLDELGPEDPRAREFRGRLATALY